jgi:hypothetical protein
LKTILESITELQDKVIEAKDLSIGLMVEKSGTRLEMEFIDIAYALSGALRKIQRAKEMALEGE